MPELDGIEATQLIRANKTIAQPYIVAMTANAMPEDRLACISAGMNDFVAKPIRLNDVHACLAIALEAKEAQGVKGAKEAGAGQNHASDNPDASASA